MADDDDDDLEEEDEEEEEDEPRPAAAAESFAIRQLRLLEQKSATIIKIREADGDEEDVQEAERVYKKALKALKKEENACRKKRKPTAHVVRQKSLKLKTLEYQPVYRVPAGAKAACKSLRELLGVEKFYTPVSGRVCPVPCLLALCLRMVSVCVTCACAVCITGLPGSVTHLSYHGYPGHCYKVKTECYDGSGAATIHEWKDNDSELGQPEEGWEEINVCSPPLPMCPFSLLCNYAPCVCPLKMCVICTGG